MKDNSYIPDHSSNELHSQDSTKSESQIDQETHKFASISNDHEFSKKTELYSSEKTVQSELGFSFTFYETIFDRDIDNIGEAGNKNKKKSILIIVASIIAVLLIAVIIFIIIFIKKRKTQENTTETQEMKSGSSTFSGTNTLSINTNPEFGTFDNPLNEREQIQDPFDQNFSEGD